MSPVGRMALVYLAAVSVLTAAVTLADKLRAKQGKWRIRESTLLLFAFAGGSAAELVTMLLIRHKTRHIKFMLGLPLICVVQGAAVIAVIKMMPVIADMLSALSY